MRAFPFYYGWLALAIGAIAEIFAMGSTSYAAGLFVLPLQSEFHLSRANANSPILILFLGSAIVAPFVGKALDRYSIRLVMSLGAVILGVSFAGIAFASSLWTMAILLVLPAALGFMCLGPLTTATLASRWFDRRRGLALGIAAVATSGGGLVVVPPLSKAIQLYGWRTGLFYEAIVIGVIVVALALFLLRDAPSQGERDEHPEHRNRQTGSPPGPAQEGAISRAPLIRWKDILGSRGFWLPSLVLATVSGTAQALVITLVPYGVQLGFSATSSALLISAFSVLAGLTKVSAGLLADHVNQRILLIASAAFMMLSMLLLYFSPTYEAVLAGACLAGISLGCALPTAAALIAENFGSTSFGSAMGWTYALIGSFAIFQVRVIGSVYDRMGSYRPAFAAFFVLAICVLAMTAWVSPRKALR